MQKISKTLEVLSHIATLIALAIGLYAIVYPATVSDYLSEVAKNTSNSADSLSAIEGTSSEISDNTGVLAKSLPYWIETLGVSNSLARSTFRIDLRNTSQFNFSDVSVSIVSEDGIVFPSANKFVIPPRESVFSIVMVGNKKPKYYCLSAISSAHGKSFYEARTFIYQHLGGTVKFSSYEFSDEPIEYCPQ